jgi:cytochrome P450
MDTPPNTSPTRKIPSNFLGTRLSADNPFPLVAQWRSTGPLVQLSLPSDPSQKAWVVTRMDEAVQILKDHTHFTVDIDVVSPELLEQIGFDSSGTVFVGQSMLSVDEPKHRRLRRLVAHVFTPSYIASLRPSIQRIADTLLDRVEQQRQMDLVNDFAYPLPITVISEMLGIPEHGREQIKQWAQGLASGSTQIMSQSAQAFSSYLEMLVTEKRQQPTDDLICRLFQLEEANGLSERELLANIGLLIFAGHETTASMISMGMLTLFNYAEQLDLLKRDLRLVPSAVEELLRFTGPAFASPPRFVTQDIVIGGQQLRQGERVIVLLGSANRDERHFSDPDELRIARGINNHIAFGQGIHTCLGAPLARLESEIAFTTLLRRFPHLQLDPARKVKWSPGNAIRGLMSLPVTF